MPVHTGPGDTMLGHPTRDRSVARIRTARLLLALLTVAALAVPAAVAAAPPAYLLGTDDPDATDVDTVGMVDGATGLWYLLDRNGNTATFFYGNPGDEPFAGDWDCDGIDTPGLHRRSDGFVYLRNSNTPGPADVEYFFGNRGDLPLAGDFDGDGCDSVSLYRPAEARVFIHNRLGSASTGLGAAELDYLFGNPGDTPFVADFDADGIDEIGLHRASTGLVYYRAEHADGNADLDFIYGNPRDRLVGGDWTGDGTDTVAVFRPDRTEFLFRHRNSAGNADNSLVYGRPTWRPVAGMFGTFRPPSGKGTLVVHGTGDVNFDPGYGPNPQHSFDYAWSGLDGLFLDDDLTVINLECVPSLLGSAVPKAYNFRCPLGALAPTRRAGVEVANQANNHGGDYGIAALMDGLENLREVGIAPVGAGIDVTAANSPALFEINGWTVAVLGFNGVISHANWIATDSRPGMASGDDTARMVAAVRAADQVADLVFVTVHWGREATFTPEPGDVVRAHAMIDAGADAIFGHHAHRLQPLDFYRGRPVFWGLGNFVWQSRERSRRTAVAEVVVQPDGTVFARQIPADIADKGHPVLVR